MLLFHICCCWPSTAGGTISAVQAVIGAGPCGLAVARELLKEGHNVTIFDAGDAVGGAWRFDESATDSDLLGLDSSRVRVHSSM